MSDEAAATSTPANKRWRVTLLLLLSGPAALAVASLASQRPDLVEAVHAQRVFPLTQTLLRLGFAWWPVSAAEALLASGLVLVLWRSWRGAQALLRGQASALTLAGRALIQALAIGSAGVAVFIGLWGILHARLPLAEHAGYELAPAAPGELEALVAELVDRCNDARPGVQARDLQLELDPDGVDARLLRGYARYAEEVPALDGPAPRVREALASRALSRLSVSGIYSPFTAEAHVNGELPASHLAFTAAHEVAHQRGFAREDEANFIAWRVCRLSGNPALGYSGDFQALSYALGALRRTEPAAHERQMRRLGEPVRQDMRESAAFWQRWRGPVSRVARATNDAYLRSAGQPGGVASYGRMVDLMLAERRARVPDAQALETQAPETQPPAAQTPDD